MTVAEAPRAVGLANGDELLAFLHEIGDVPVGRVRLAPTPGTATVEDLDRTRDLLELVDGVLIEKAMNHDAEHLGMELGFFVRLYLEENDLGYLTGAGDRVHTIDGRVRGPDVSFFSWVQTIEQTGERSVRAQPRVPYPPVLVVEVLSPGNTDAEMREKRREYFAADARVVWEIDPLTRTVRVFEDADRSRLLAETDTLTGGDLLPGFALPLAKLFAKLGIRS